MTKERKNIGYELSGTTIRPIEHSSENNDAAFKIPIMLRDKMIGTMNIRLPDNQELGTDEADIVQTLAERISTAIENATLLEESQRRAVRESVIGDISAKLSATTDIERLMQIAVSELRNAFGASEVNFQLNTTNRQELSEKHEDKIDKIN